MLRKYMKLIEKITGLKGNEIYSGKYEFHEGVQVIAALSLVWFIIRFGFGVGLANNPDYCRVKSIGDVIIAPAYTLGCNIGKDRFDIRVN